MITYLWATCFIVQVRCSWSVYAFGWEGLDTFWNCQTFLCNQGTSFSDLHSRFCICALHQFYKTVIFIMCLTRTCVCLPILIVTTDNSHIKNQLKTIHQDHHIMISAVSTFLHNQHAVFLGEMPFLEEISSSWEFLSKFLSILCGGICFMPSFCKWIIKICLNLILLIF